jgi:hypothetical protein
VPSFKVLRRARRRMLAAVAAAGIIGSSLFAVAAPSASASASARPDTVKACDSSTKNWVATYPTVGDWLVGRDATHCIGGVSDNSLPWNETEVICAGNNKGYVKYYDLTTLTTATHSFWPDTSYEVVNGTYKEAPAAAVVDTIDVEQVQITGDSGSAGC